MKPNKINGFVNKSYGMALISIGLFAQPAPLTGGLAGATASRGATVKLASPVRGLRREEKMAAPATCGGGAGNSSCPKPEENTPLRAIKKPSAQRSTKEEGRKTLGLKAEENPREENGISNRQNYPTLISPLTKRSFTFRFPLGAPTFYRGFRLLSRNLKKI